MRARGGTLIEVVVSILLISIAAAGVFGALFSSSLQASGTSDRETAALEMQSLLDELRNYVTEDPSDASWRLPGDGCACWALQEGDHDVTARLPAKLAGRATMSYRVTVAGFGNGGAARQVRARVDWTPAS